jgi:hypothetical protein
MLTGRCTTNSSTEFGRSSLVVLQRFFAFLLYNFSTWRPFLTTSEVMAGTVLPLSKVEISLLMTRAEHHGIL